MKRNVLIFGSILGTILAVHMVYMVNLVYHNPDIYSNNTLGYIFMVVCFPWPFSVSEITATGTLME